MCKLLLQKIQFPRIYQAVDHLGSWGTAKKKEIWQGVRFFSLHSDCISLLTLYPNSQFQYLTLILATLYLCTEALHIWLRFLASAIHQRATLIRKWQAGNCHSQSTFLAWRFTRISKMEWSVLPRFNFWCPVGTGRQK